jgi:hypothetical protein
MLSKENVRILEPFKKNLETAHFGWKWLLLSVEIPASPEIVMKGLRGEVNNIGVRD